MALADTLAQGPQLGWFIAVVESIQSASKSVTVTYLGGSVPHVGYLAHYTPTVGDVVHGLIWEPQGMIILGKEVLRPTVAIPPGAAATTVAPTSRATWTEFEDAPSAWLANAIVHQSLTEDGAFFYSAGALSAVAVADWAAFEVQVTTQAGSGPLSIVLHGSTLADPFIQVSDLQLRSTPEGVATWVALPLAWADALRSGTAKGIGFTSDIYQAAVSGGTLRFTPL